MLMSVLRSEGHGTTYIGEVRTVVTFHQPRWLGIRDFTNFTLDHAIELGFFSFDKTNLETLVLWTFKNFITMKTEESFSRVLSSYGKRMRYLDR